jgi:hydrogenase maturation protein HypF
VHIHINADEQTVRDFQETLRSKLPPLAVVTDWHCEVIDFIEYIDFQIVESHSKQRPNLLITPDVAMCKDCRQELHNSDDRRYQYPFITCTNCGPRYSIITALPYDRPNTTMAKFTMCPVCLDEYNNPLERRHFSQTNSCPDCAVEMQLYENGQLTGHFTDLDYIVSQWQAGKIIAIKGIGGYLLTCDATNPNAVQELRLRKKRPVKPFALMYPDMASIKKDVFISQTEQKALQSIEAPIVLLRHKTNPRTGIAMDEINKGLTRVGTMLPYTPLYDLLLQKFGRPIVATSGNISQSTIIFQDKKAIAELTKIADILLMNNRDIVIPQDDGVVQFSTEKRQKIVLRRSRGKAPVYINPKLQWSDKTLLATGSMLKSNFGILTQKNVYISQYLGNTESYDAQVNYQAVFKHLTDILQTDFELVITDKHPGYFATQFGKEIARKNNIKHVELQHHKAHFYSVLGENDLINTQEKILGVIWDGTGLGDDGNIWGGEFFVYQNKQVKRIGHISEFDFILADKMVKEPRISVLAMLYQNPKAEQYLKNKFTATEWHIYKQLLANSKLKSTSMGRVFDAVASLLFGYDKHRFDAEASIRLEQAASRGYENHQINLSDSYWQNDFGQIATLFEGILQDLGTGINKDLIALRFHISLVAYILDTAQKNKLRHLAFSGGVFQNSLLINLIIKFLQPDYNLYFHKEFSPNDEGIPFGQLVYGNLIVN